MVHNGSLLLLIFFNYMLGRPEEVVAEVFELEGLRFVEILHVDAVVTGSLVTPILLKFVSFWKIVLVHV